jgi:S1-C subfamily serine protease
MKIRILRIFLLFTILIFFVNIYGQDKDYGILNVGSIANPKNIGTYSYKVYINDNLVTSIQPGENLRCKTISTDRLSITIVASDASRISFVVDAKSGNQSFIYRDATLTGFKQKFYFHVADSIEGKMFLSKVLRTIEVEEDINHPWGKIDNTKKSGKGQGTCFAISSNGYLVTNYHCIENAKEITVKGIDGDLTTKYGATVVASDPSNDLALIKVSNKNVKFNVPDFGVRSSGVAQAEKVYALGFPAAAAMGAEVKITEGIISAKSGVGGDISKLQISAAVNPGNSGGPLIDEQGNLVGVIYAKSTIAESAGYAIKASYLETFLKNVDGFEFPTFTNTMKDKSLTDKVADWKNFIFIVETN